MIVIETRFIWLNSANKLCWRMLA